MKEKKIHEIGLSLNKDETEFFGEWVFYETSEEYEDAIKYLQLWKKFILKKLYYLEQIGVDHIILKNDIHGTGKNTLGIKIEMKNKN